MLTSDSELDELYCTNHIKKRSYNSPYLEMQVSYLTLEFIQQVLV